MAQIVRVLSRQQMFFCSNVLKTYNVGALKLISPKVHNLMLNNIQRCQIQKISTSVKAFEKLADNNHNCNNEIESLAQSITEFYETNNIGGINKEKLFEICKLFVDCGVECSLLKEELCMVPEPIIVTTPYTNLTGLLDVFLGHGVDASTALKVLSLYPKKLITQEYLEKSLLWLRTIVIHNDTLLDHLVSCPSLVPVDKNYIREKVHAMAEIFPSKEFEKLLSNVPQLLLEPWEQTLKKIYFINDEMGLDQPHMVHNKSLSHSFRHIYYRHRSILHAGIYKKPKLFRNRLSHLSNPKLELILDSSDFYFATQVLGISLEEYEMYVILWQQELNMDENGEGLVRDSDAEEKEDIALEIQALRDSYVKGPRKKKHLKGRTLKPKRWQLL